MFGVIDNILYEGLPYCFLALGLVLTLRYLRLIDLTFSASFVLGPAITAGLMVSGWGFPASIAAGFLATMVLATFAHSLTYYLDIDYLLSSLLASFAGFALALLFTQGTLSLHTITNPLAPLKSFDQVMWASGLPLHPAQISFFAILLWVIKSLIDRYLESEAGLAFRALEDERSAKVLLPSLGISANRLKLAGVVCGNILSASAGMIVMLKESQVTANRGFDALVLAIAAYLLGVTLFEQRPSHRMPSGLLFRLISNLQKLRPTTSAILGIILYYAVLVIVSRLDIPSSVPKLIFVAFVVIVLIMNRWPELSASRAERLANSTSANETAQSFEASGVSVAYPGFPEPNCVLRNISFKVARGHLTHFVGPNGSGKTTLLKFLASYVSGRGVVTVPVAPGRTSYVTSRSEIVGYVSQDASLSTPGSLYEAEFRTMCRIGSKASKIKSWRQTAAEFENVNDLFGQTPIGMLSGGQRQYLNIQSFIDRCNSPEIVLLDEPLTHLDEPHAQKCVDLIEKMLLSGKTLLLVQHDLDSSTEYAHLHARGRLAKLVSERISLTALEQRS